MYLSLENLGQFYIHISHHDTTTWQKTMEIWYHSSKLPPSQNHLLETYTQYRPITRQDIRYILWVPNQGELRPSISNTNHHIQSCYISFCRVIAFVKKISYELLPNSTCKYRSVYASLDTFYLKLDVTMTRQPASETRDFHVKVTWLKFVAVVVDLTADC